MSRLPTLAVLTPNLGTGKWVTDITVTQGEGLHEVAELTVVHAVPRGTASAAWSLDTIGTLPEGTPVAVSYGRQDSAATFYGYVTSVSAQGTDAAQLPSKEVRVRVVYTLTGTTSGMQSQNNRVWPNGTASYIARTIIRSAGLRQQVQTDSRQFENMPQTGTSDFAFLRGLASQIGYRLVANGSTVALTDPLVSLREPAELSPTFVYDKSGRDTVKSWSSTAGQTDPLGGLRTRREGYSYNFSTGATVRQVAAGTQDASVVQYTAGQPLASQAAAQQILGAQAKRESLWVYAKTTLLGESSVRVGTPLYMTGAALGPNDAGAWMARTVTHRISVTPNQPAGGAYWTDVELGRNRVDGLDFTSKAAVVDTIPDGTALINGRWQAQYLGGA